MYTTIRITLEMTPIGRTLTLYLVKSVSDVRRGFSADFGASVLGASDMIRIELRLWISRTVTKEKSALVNDVPIW